MASGSSQSKPEVDVTPFGVTLKLNGGGLPSDEQMQALFAGLQSFAGQQAEKPWVKLMDAVQDGDEGAVKALLDDGVKPDERRNRGAWAPIVRAAIRGHVGVVKMLLDAGADPNQISTEDEQSALTKLQDVETWIPYCVTGYRCYEVEGDFSMFGSGAYDEETQRQRRAELDRMIKHAKDNLEAVRALLVEAGGKALGT